VRVHADRMVHGRAMDGRSLEGAVAVNVKGEHLACSASAAPIVARVDTRGVGVLLYLKMYTAFFHGFGAVGAHRISVLYIFPGMHMGPEGRHPWAHATCGRGVRVALPAPAPRAPAGCAGTALYIEI
jgi:hypothetical protein